MIDKELSELIDALTREDGEPMPPYQELEILGFNPLGEAVLYQRKKFTFSDDDDEDFIPSEAEDDEIDYGEEENEENDGYIDEEYELDEDNEEYSLLVKVLRLNNCRKKYFA